MLRILLLQTFTSYYPSKKQSLLPNPAHLIFLIIWNVSRQISPGFRVLFPPLTLRLSFSIVTITIFCRAIALMIANIMTAMGIGFGTIIGLIIIVVGIH